MDKYTENNVPDKGPPERAPNPVFTEPPLIKTVEEYNGPMFPRDVIEEFQRHFKEDPLGLVRRAGMWVHYSQQCPTLPKIETLTPFDVPAILAIRNIEASDTWETFAKKCNLKLEQRLDDVNPWLPSWSPKSEDKKHSWLRSIENTVLETNQSAQLTFTNIIKDACPYGAGSVTSAIAMASIGASPTEDAQTLGEIVDRLINMGRYWCGPLGDDTLDPDFRFGKQLCLLGGLGFDVIRVAAMTFKDDYEGWDFWETCTHEQLTEAVLKARRIHGYPIGLLRVDAPKLISMLERYEIEPGEWLQPLVMLHILKYVRYAPHNMAARGPILQIMYDGTRVVLPLEPAQLKQPFSTNINSKMAIDLARSIGLPFRRPTGRNAFTAIYDAVHRALCKMLPTDLCELRSVDECYELAVPPKVKIVPVPRQRAEYNFIDYGVGVTNIASIDYETGDVVHERIHIGPHVGAIHWPIGDMDPAELATWKACLPKKVELKLPSETTFHYVRNCNDLGFTRARNALYDSIVLMNICRRELAGSIMGNSLVAEFPIAMVLPMGHTKEETTNQGKTNLARILINAIRPGVPVTIASRSSSAPAQRAAAFPLEAYGTAIYDEFQLPNSHEHFLAQAGIQSLCTGGVATPGRANENSEGVKLKFSFAICAKISAFPPDIRNRAACFFMDILDDASRCSDEEMLVITTNVASNTVRMNAVAWAKRINFVEKIKDMKPMGSPHFRFAAFLRCAVTLCIANGGTEQEVYDYLAASAKKCDEQHAKATESGLADDIGANTAFSMEYFFDNLSDHTLEILVAASLTKVYTAQDLAFQIIQDGETRRIGVVRRDYENIKEKAIVQRFQREVAEGKLINGSCKVVFADYYGATSKKTNGTESSRKRYRVIRQQDCGPVDGSPTAHDLEAHLKQDTVAQIQDLANHPEKYRYDKPTPKG
jgi:hypothetical protein